MCIKLTMTGEKVTLAHWRNTTEKQQICTNLQPLTLSFATMRVLVQVCTPKHCEYLCDFWNRTPKNDQVKWAASWQNQQSECVPSQDSDQPGHPPSLIRVFAVRMKKAWILSYLLSAQRRLWSDWADAQADLSLRWAHSHIVDFVTRRLKWFFRVMRSVHVP